MNRISGRRSGERGHAITNLFLTGPPGTGKTSLLFSALKACLPLDASWPGWPGAGGFVVKRVYRGGRRVALDLVDLATGQRATLVSFPAPDRPQVTLEAFTGIGAAAVRRALEEARVVVMDELGRFEQGAPAFLAAVHEALDSPIPVVGVLKAESNPFLDAIRARPDTLIVNLEPPRNLRRAAEAQFAEAVAELLEDRAATRGLPRPGEPAG
jgi:nucleoside-triphosphatase